MHIDLKLGNMKKPQSFTVYPRPTNVSGDYDEVTIQSDKRICRFNAKTGKGLLSNGKGGHPGFHMLNSMFKPIEVTIPQDVLKELVENVPQKGDHIGGGIIIG